MAPSVVAPGQFINHWPLGAQAHPETAILLLDVDCPGHDVFDPSWQGNDGRSAGFSQPELVQDFIG